MIEISGFLDHHPEMRSALRVFVYAFLGTFFPSLLGWLGEVLSWTSQEGAVFPAVAPLGKAIVAALVGAVSGLLAFAYNKLPNTKSAQYPAAENKE